MYKYFFIYSVFLNVVLSDPFFSFPDKPIFFCLKVCPLYCSKRRSDEDAASLIYLEDTEDSSYTFGPDVWVEEDPTFTPYPYPYGHIIYSHPRLETTTVPTTTTSMKPTTTTKASSYICDLCKSKCNYPKSSDS